MGDENSYFYTDPLAAAWMSDMQGMRFRLHDRRGSGVKGVYSLLQALRHGTRATIHPDSLHLLELREGDTITSGGGQFHFLCSNSGVYGTPLQSLPQHIAPLGIKHVRIIQRKGQPFHWPECE